MCTLLFGRDVLGPGTLIAATNRDEAADRPSEPPRVLASEPRVIGGRDGRAGGTWLAVRGRSPGGPAAVALLNRRDPDAGRAARRSRGLLAIDVARAERPRDVARAAADSGDYAPCSLVWLSALDSWWLAMPHGESARLEDLPAGWHALAHAGLDDPAEPRTAWLAGRLARARPASRQDAEAMLVALIASHGDAESPAVCLHDRPHPTVSAATLWFAGREASYRHAEGPPCRTPFDDYSHLLATAPAD